MAQFNSTHQLKYKRYPLLDSIGTGGREGSGGSRVMVQGSSGWTVAIISAGGCQLCGEEGILYMTANPSCTVAHISLDH